jgi:DNA repair photolyase
MQRFTGHINEEWGRFVDVKVNASEVLEKQLWRKRKGKREQVLLSSVTDAYQPVERKYGITRRCLELLDEYNFPISILTKSDLVLRDADILGNNKDNDVGFTIISLKEKVRRAFESGAPSTSKRLNALRTLSEQGIKTWGFVGPIIPHLSTENFPELIRSLADSGVDYVLFDRLNLRPRVKSGITKTLEVHYPDMIKNIMNSLTQNSPYYEIVRSQILDLAKIYSLEVRIVF